jgi:DNA-binding XRE family transcriptional regulator
MKKIDITTEAEHIGDLLGRLRLAHDIKQNDAAQTAGLSRTTAYRIEKGDPTVALGQILRYLQAITPGLTLQDLLNGTDAALEFLEEQERRHRVRGAARPLA